MGEGYKQRLIEELEDIPASTIAYRMHVHINTVRNWKKGVTDMSLGSFIELVRKFNLDANYIIKGKEGAPDGIEYR